MILGPMSVGLNPLVAWWQIHTYMLPDGWSCQFPFQLCYLLYNVSQQEDQITIGLSPKASVAIRM